MSAVLKLKDVYRVLDVESKLRHNLLRFRDEPKDVVLVRQSVFQVEILWIRLDRSLSLDLYHALRDSLPNHTLLLLLEYVRRGQVQ